MAWKQHVADAVVTAEQLVVARLDLAEYDTRFPDLDEPGPTRLEFLRDRWPEWGEITCGAVFARLHALDVLRTGGKLDGVDLLEGAVMAAAAEAPIAVVDGSWTLDWARFISIAHDANRSEMQGTGLIPMDEGWEDPPEAANDAGEGGK